MPQKNNYIANTCTCAQDEQYFLSDAGKKQSGFSIDVSGLIDAVIKNVFDKKDNEPAQDRQLIHDQYSQLRQSVKEGTGKLTVEFKYGKANPTMQKNLQTNLAVFSAFKKHDMMKEMAGQLRDSRGNLKPWNTFRSDAKELIGKYRDSWLKVEYNTAVRGCRMATVWEKIKATQNLYPNIKYTLSRSAQKRVDHEALVGTILPINHPFWSTNFPPNGYECKCGAQATDEQPTDVPVGVEIDPAFAFNPGVEGKVFDTEKHQYAKLPQKEYKAALQHAWGALCSFEKKASWQQAKDSGITNKKVEVSGLPAPVQFNKTSWAKNQEYNHHFFDKMAVLNNIEELLKESIVILVENRKPKQHVKQYHILSYKGADGKRVSFHIEERKDGTCWLYYIHLQK